MLHLNAQQEADYKFYNEEVSRIDEMLLSQGIIDELDVVFSTHDRTPHTTDLDQYYRGARVNHMVEEDINQRDLNHGYLFSNW